MRALPPHPTSEGSSSDKHGQWTVPPARKRSKHVWLACNACKRRKSKCDGFRPKCSCCQTKGSECEYDDAGRESNSIPGLKRQLEKFESLQNIYKRLKDCPEEEALGIFGLIRSGSSIQSLCIGSSDMAHSTQLLGDTEIIENVKGAEYDYGLDDSGQASWSECPLQPGLLHHESTTSIGSVNIEAQHRHSGNTVLKRGDDENMQICAEARSLKGRLTELVRQTDELRAALESFNKRPGEDRQGDLNCIRSGFSVQTSYDSLDILSSCEPSSNSHGMSLSSDTAAGDIRSVSLCVETRDEQPLLLPLPATDDNSSCGSATVEGTSDCVRDARLSLRAILN